MSSFLNTFWKAGLPFGVFIGIFYGIKYGLQFGFLGGLASGIMFGVAIASFVAYQSSKFTKDRPLLADETLIKEGGANHFLNGEAVGGWIYLTDKRLYFVSHSTNIQNHEMSILPSEIVKAEKANTFGIIPNQLRLTLQNGQVEKFVVNGASEWVSVIKNLA